MTLEALDSRIASLSDRISKGEAIDWATEERVLVLDAVRAQIGYTRDALGRLHEADERLEGSDGG